MLGIPGLFSTLRLQQSADVMRIHGGRGTLDVVAGMLAGLWGEGRAPIPLQFVPLAEGRILDAGGFTVDCFRVRHRDTESFAFSFESQMRRHLLPDRLSVLGVPDGAVRKELAEGSSGWLCSAFALENRGQPLLPHRREVEPSRPVPLKGMLPALVTHFSIDHLQAST